MRKTRVLFFSADPFLGRPDGRPLELGDELREIHEQVRKARYGRRLVFENHGAARVDDLMDVLENTDAQVVHFSGHGGREGLVLVGRDGHSRHPVGAEALKEMFRTYDGPVRLAVLSACSSHAEAQAIADVVGCAIGTSSRISDDAAITFSSRFYRAIANGRSVKHAFKEARMALQAHRIPRTQFPNLFRRRDVDLDALVLVRAYRLVLHRLVVAATACVLTAVATGAGWFERNVVPEPSVSDVACGAEWSLARRSARWRSATAATAGDPSGAAEHVEDARAFYRARNYRAAARAFQEAATAGSGAAMGCLRYMYLHGLGVDSQPAVGAQWLRRAAREERDAHGMYALAMAYLTGNGVERAGYRAEEWLLKAVREKGYAEAMRAIGDLYRQEMNASSRQQALTWYHRAVAAGSVDARVDVGLMHEMGWGTARDEAAAFQWYRSAVQLKSPRGAFALGQSYDKGVGVRQDYELAMKWYQRAANAGSADAMNSIGVLYERGLGVRRSRAQAIRWYDRAAQAGSRLARGNLAAHGRD